MSDELLNGWRSQIQGLKETDGMDPHALTSLDKKLLAMEVLLEPLAQDGYAWLKTSGCAKLFVNYFGTRKPMEDKEVRKNSCCLGTRCRFFKSDEVIHVCFIVSYETGACHCSGPGGGLHVPACGACRGMI